MNPNKARGEPRIKAYMLSIL